MEDYGKYTSKGVCTEPKQMANACPSAEEPSGWEEIRNRLEMLIANTERLSQDSWNIRAQLVGLPPGPDAPNEKQGAPSGDFLNVMFVNLTRLEAFLVSIHYDIQAIRNGRA